MSTISWFGALNPWHVTLLIAMAYALWQTIAQYPLRILEQSLARLSVVNFLVVQSFSILIFASAVYIYDSGNAPLSMSLLQVTFLTWTLTVGIILYYSNIHQSLKAASLILILGVVPIHYLYQGGVTGFLSRLDEFTNPSSVAGSGLKLSEFLRWLYFFTHSFIFLNYYGRMYEISYREKIKRGERKEGLQEDAINRAIGVLAMAISFIISLALIGTDIGKLSLFSGLVAAGVSIALRDLLANMAAGILLLWDKSIKVEDVVSLDSERYGVVKSMTMRYLILEDRNDIRFLVPNSDLINRTITNWTQATRKVRLKLNFGVSYDADIEKVKDIIAAICLRNSRVLQDPPPRLLVLSLGDSTIDFQLRFFISDPEKGIRNVMGEIYEQILRRFKDKESHISIPFPQREIRILPSSSIDLKLVSADQDDFNEAHRTRRKRSFKFWRR